MTSLAARLAGTIRAPRATFSRLLTASSAPWLDVLLVSTCALFLARAAILSTDVGRLALLDQWEWTYTAFGGQLDDALYARLQDASTHTLLISAAFAVLLGPALTMLMTLVASAMLRMTRAPRTTLALVLSVVSHAGFILALRELIAAPVHYLNESFNSPTSLGLLMVGANEGSPFARFLGAIDVFVLWWLFVIAAGLATLSNRTVRRTVVTLAGTYAVVAIVLALAMAASGGTT